MAGDEKNDTGRTTDTKLKIDASSDIVKDSGEKNASSIFIR